MDPDASDSENDERSTIRRVSLFAIAGYFLLAVFFAFRGDWHGLIGLTCSALLVMINFLWLDEIVTETLRPAPQVKAWRLAVRTVSRLLLFGVALSVIMFVARFNALSVLLGFSVIVIGILGEAAYSVVRIYSSKT